MLSSRAIVLLSGGLDSATTLAIARDEGFICHALSFDYGQQHRIELKAAARVAQHLGVEEHCIYPLSSVLFGGSALTDPEIEVPDADIGADAASRIPVTYVPARNTVFLSLALAWAETLSAADVFIGANAVDYSGYPDCRPEFLTAFENLANLATRAGVNGEHIRIHAPLVELSKADIIRRGAALGVDYAMTVSCYRADKEGHACGLCDSCRFRVQGFRDAAVADPTPYQKH